MADVFDTIEKLQGEIRSVNISDTDVLEQFRIKFLGSKNIIKPLFGEIRNIENDRKKEFGQLVNALKPDSMKQN